LSDEDSETAAHFVRENSSWKIDLGTSLDESGQLLKKLGAEQNLTESDIVEMGLSEYFPPDEVTAAYDAHTWPGHRPLTFPGPR
jgi:hypothetical protein